MDFIVAILMILSLVFFLILFSILGGGRGVSRSNHQQQQQPQPQPQQSAQEKPESKEEEEPTPPLLVSAANANNTSNTNSNSNSSEEKHSNDDDDEPIGKLLEPFSNLMILTLLHQAAEADPQLCAGIRRLADADPSHHYIYVGRRTTVATLCSVFAQYGEIESCRVATDKVSGKPKGFAFILFKSRRGVRKALEQPEKIIGNRRTACSLADSMPSSGRGRGGDSGSAHHHHHQLAAVLKNTRGRKIHVHTEATISVG